jgi:hypothetical protein
MSDLVNNARRKPNNLQQNSFMESSHASQSAFSTSNVSDYGLQHLETHPLTPEQLRLLPVAHQYSS